ncbi:MAG: esterase/lipase family protein [Verrucomicrobium sp.]
MRLFSLFIASLCVLQFSACTTVPKGGAAHGATPTSGAATTALATALSQAEAKLASGLKTDEDRQAYAQAVEEVVAAWQSQSGQPSQTQAVTVQSGQQTIVLSASWPAEMLFDSLIPARPVGKRKLDHVVQREGVGCPFVARWKSTDERRKTHPFMSDGGYLTPTTATVEFSRGSGGQRLAHLRVHDPRREEFVRIAGTRQPLAGDFSAVSEQILAISQEKGVGMSGLGALRNSSKNLDKLGLMSLEPPSRDRIPVIFVHGLMSRPLTWFNACNELQADESIYKKYQVYFFRYPSGVPVVYSSAKFRQQLSLLHNELERIGNDKAAHHMVLIGHSMGGLVSKMQITSSGDRLWVNVLGAKPQDLGLTKEEMESFRQYLEFHPNPYVDRVIFVCTPHRGSKLAEGFVGAVGRRLISLPTNILGNTFDLLQGQAPTNSRIRQLLEKGVPSSIENLSSESRFVRESIQLPLKPGLHVHSIIGNKDGRKLDDPKCSDGVVPYTSAHLDGVDSELVVRANHGAHETAEAIAELRRILLLHLKSVGER